MPIKEIAGPEKSANANPAAQTNQPDPYQYRDLMAQEQMAIWAFWMFVVACLTFLITTFGTLLIWRQVSLTRKAVEDTREATRQMEFANVISREANRPWLKLHPPHAIVFHPVGNESPAISVQVFAENLGTVPAVDVYLRPQIIHAPGGYHDIHEIQRLLRQAFRGKTGATLHVNEKAEIDPNTTWVQNPVRAIGDYEDVLPPELPQHLLGLIAFYRHATHEAFYYVAGLYRIEGALPQVGRVKIERVAGEFHGAIRFRQNGSIESREAEEQ